MKLKCNNIYKNSYFKTNQKQKKLTTLKKIQKPVEMKDDYVPFSKLLIFQVPEKSPKDTNIKPKQNYITKRFESMKNILEDIVDVSKFIIDSIFFSSKETLFEIYTEFKELIYPIKKSTQKLFRGKNQ